MSIDTMHSGMPTASEARADFRYDVVVVGGGMAGCVAALAAAKAGVSVLLIEQNAFLGGAATAGGVGQFVGWQTRSGRQVVCGYAQEIIERLRNEGGCGEIERFTMSTGHVMNRIQYDVELLKIVLDDVLTDAGVDILFKSAVIDGAARIGRLASISVWSAGRMIQISASSFVDASGDMSLLVKAGAEFLDLDTGQTLQPGTMMFAVSPVNFKKLDGISESRMRALAQEGVDQGVLPRAALHYSKVPQSSSAWFNISRVVVDPDDPFSISRAEIEGRRQVREISRYLISRVPGCENARLSSMAPQLGIRDTRRVRGDYVITREDIATGIVFEDTVACGAYPIDIHRADTPTIDFIEFGEDHHYSIPLRALIPAGLKNVLAAGRGISATHDAFAALRVMPTAMAMGHAAGLAGAMASALGQGDVRAVDGAQLRAGLVDTGAYLGE